MVDLPLPSTSPTAAAAAPRGAATRVASARDANAQTDEGPFQAVLAQEIALAPCGRTVPIQELPSAAEKADKATKSGEDKAQAAAAGDPTAAPTAAGVIALLPAFSGAPAPAAAPANAPALAAEGVSATSTRAAPATGPRQIVLAKDATAPGAEARLPAAPSAAEIAAPGNSVPHAESGIQREIAFASALLEQHKAPATAIHAAAMAPAEPAQTPVAALDARVGERGWDQGLGEKLVWMAGQKQQVAELHLNPPELGPLKITLTLNHDQASAQFVSAHAPVRDAIEAAMPRLREMLADSGITLGNTSVSTDAFREQAQPQQEARAFASAPARAAADSGAVALGERMLARAHGLVDTFA